MQATEHKAQLLPLCATRRCSGGKSRPSELDEAFSSVEKRSCGISHWWRRCGNL